MPEHRAPRSKTWIAVAISVVLTASVVGLAMFLVVGDNDNTTSDELAAANATIAEQTKQIDDLTNQVTDLTAANEKLTKQYQHQKTAHVQAEHQVEDLKASASGDLTDGRYPVHVKAADATSGSESMTVDVIQFYTGDAANRASKEDGGEVPVPNDIYIRNESTKLRTIPVAPGTTATVPYWQGPTMVNPPDGTKVSFSQFASAMNGNKSWQQSDQNAIYWITLSGGQVTKITYQYTP
jgi:uncharacterized protein YoxC